MRTVQADENKPTFSRLIFGVMKWGVWGHDYSPKKVLDLISASLDLGITTFDHADIYGYYTTEALFGEAIKGSPALRQRIQLISKCGIKLITPNRPEHHIKSYDTSKAHIVASVENSLRNLRTDYLDVLLIHRPSPLMHPDEMAAAFDTLQASGKVLHFGASNFTPSQFDLLYSRFPLITNQIEASLLYLTPFLDGTLDQLLQLHLIPMAWSPLGGGSIFQDTTDEQSQRIRLVAHSLGEKYGNKTIDQMLLAWLLKHPSKIFPILGTGNIARVQAAVEALSIDLSTEDWFKLWEASTGKEVA
ncbi:MAG: aldo/keto reductase [Saprospiraceae bacterium]|nr:aldo/keto reductase [Saprospiraceae bacterium]